jgi:mRNA interferase HigB
MEKPHKNRIISRKKFREFLQGHPEHRKAKAIFDEFYRTLLYARWQNFAAVRETYGDASLVGKFVVFNLGGNKFRVVIELNYNKHLFLIRYVMTHTEYDQGRWKRPRS